MKKKEEERHAEIEETPTGHTKDFLRCSRRVVFWVLRIVLCNHNFAAEPGTVEVLLCNLQQFYPLQWDRINYIMYI